MLFYLENKFDDNFISLLLVVLLHLVDRAMEVPRGCLMINTIDTNTVRLRRHVGIPSIKCIQMKNVSNNKALR